MNEVEDWVVKAISSGLVDARMDQLTSTVTVTRSVQREFSGSQWRLLKERLDAWAGNIGAMLKSVEESRNI